MLALVIGLTVLLAGGAFLWRRDRARWRARVREQAGELEEQRARHALAEREEARRRDELFDRMIEGVIVLDAAERVTLANRAARELFGAAAPAAGRGLLEVVRHHEVAAVVARVKNEGAVAGHALRLESTPPRFLEVNAAALRDERGGAAGAVLVFHDVTRLRELERTRQEFVANVSHELRTPLSLIKGAVEMLLDGGGDEADTRGRLCTIIDRHANRLVLLIDDLLLLSQLESGRVTLNLRPVAVRAVAQETLEDLGPRAAGRQMQLHNAVPAELIAWADADRLRQALFNLVDNAIKYGRAGGNVEMTGRVVDGLIELGVRDDGPGIAPEAQARVFERFFRADKARSREQGGTGLGLAIVKHIVQAHGGDVRVESTPGHGAAFFLTLKRVPERED